MRAIFKYPGSKWSINQWIIDHFPEHHSYLEPFFGSGGVFFKKKRSPIETINDLDHDVVNFFQQCVKDPERLAREIYLMPYAREIYEKAITEMRSGGGTAENDIHRAAMFAAKLMMGFGFRTNEFKAGWKRDIQGREAAYAANDWCNMPERVLEAAERLRGVQIENRPAVQLIREFNSKNVLIYADPPYILSSRSCRRGQYKHEMTDEDHEELLDALIHHKGPVLLSGYENDLYNDRLKDWTVETIDARAQTGGKRQEVLWMNFEPPKQQLSMF